MQSLDHIFQFHPATCSKSKAYDRLRSAAKAYAEALISEKILDDQDDLVIEMAYEDYIRTLNELVPTDSPEYLQAVKYIDQAYDLAVDPNRAIVLLVQSASYLANAALALSPD
jgi:hypothetical protein